MLLLQLIVNGIVIGSIYALMSMTFSLILTVTKVWHFAHAGVYTIGAYTIYLFVSKVGLPLWAGLLLATVVTGVLGYLIEVWAYRPLRKKRSESLTFFIVSLIVNTLFVNIIVLFFNTSNKSYYESTISKSHSLGTVSVTNWDIAVMIISCLIIGSVLWIIRYSRWGQALIAISTNAEMAEVIGIDPNKAYAQVMILGSILTVPVVALIGIHTGINPDMGANIILIAVVATILGGLNSIYGAAIGGVIIGVLENVGIWKLDSEWQSAIAFGVLFLIIVIRPSGLFGRKLGTTGV